MLGVAALAFVVARGSGPQVAAASSHAEAPLISEDPRADNTDLYAFVSPDRPDTVTIVANYIPLEAPASGPNFPAFDDSVRYEINVDRNGDGKDDLSYEFRFTTITRNPNTFLYNTGPISSLTDPNWNRVQTYSVTRVDTSSDGHKDGHDNGHNDNQTTVLGENLPTPPDNIGPRSTPNYTALASAAVSSIGDGIKVFAGQRDDPFFVDLGSVFDLAGLRPFNPFHLIPLPAESGRDAVARFNTHTIAIQVPISQLAMVSNTTIGIYASASRQQETILRDDGTKDGNGPWVQVSRLGEPLINEAVIPLGKKDFWNRADPANDAQFASFYTDPEVSRLENALYGGVLAPIATTGRSDLTAILLTGVPGLNFTGPTQSDLLRLNTAIKPSAAPSRLGVLDGDFAGFPNGRRLTDDVVDIELRAFAQGYGPVLAGALGLPNLSPNNTLADGVDSNDEPLLSTFPYVGTPHQGYEVP
ncbi:MAG: DUF4331 domain-containing protein [Actinomycetota bacterium]|nr:DUF4331 domain-containing protein [Actinomycetota bacterium]